MKASLFNSLVLVACIIGAQWWLRSHRPALDLEPAVASVEWVPIAMGPMTDRRARLAGAWELRSNDRRIGGLSGLAMDRGLLLALTDGGMLAWLPLPPGPGSALVRPLPAVPGDPFSKLGRDSEAMAPDPAGRGWWVAFEQRHQLILYDPDFRVALRRVQLEIAGFRDNRGVEALGGSDGLRWYAESDGVSDATNLPDGRQLLLKRAFESAGFSVSIIGLGGGPLRLPTDPLDNAEGLAAQELPDGSVRLWIVTDNDFRRWRLSRLIAVDVPQEAVAAD